MQKLIKYFTEGITSQTLQTIGMEIETQFVDKSGLAIQTKASQQILGRLAQTGWQVIRRQGNLITALVDQEGNNIFYELGRHNIEVSTVASTQTLVLGIGQKCLAQIYEAGQIFGAEPYLGPILEGEEDLLIIPDERDAIWLKLDGRSALAPLARTSSVQFTISVSPSEAISILNKLGKNLGAFLLDYPQDDIWKKYLADSSAGYQPDRYGGPLMFESLEDYCLNIARHDVVRGVSLVPFSRIDDLNIALHLQSIWWHFRLKRYGDTLCLEVRPTARRGDEQFPLQLEKVLSFFSS